MKHVKLSKALTAGTLVGALCLAVYVNWNTAKQAPQQLPVFSQSAEDLLETAAESTESGSVQAVFDPLETESTAETGNKNYGEAQLVSVSQNTGSKFFDEARQSRSKTRDAALDALKKSLKSSGLSQAERDALTKQLSEQVTDITVESDLETQIRAKGFADCMVFLHDGKADVTVMTEQDALTADEVTQIRDIILRKCSELRAQDITVVEVK